MKAPYSFTALLATNSRDGQPCAFFPVAPDDVGSFTARLCQSDFRSFDVSH